MNWRTIFKMQGLLLVVLACMMLLPLGFSLYYRSGDYLSLLLSFVITISCGLSLALLIKPKGEMRARDGFFSVTLGWIFATCFGALPFFFQGSFGQISLPVYQWHLIPDISFIKILVYYINCCFEAMSGFTTTGATILTEIESLPKGMLFWRSLTHWLGGMGIILLTIAVLPILGLTSGQLFNAEVPGPVKDRISPKIKDTAKILWQIYLGMTIAQTVLLMLGGMSLFDALCHTFGTLATGGFSTLNASVAGYNNLYFELVIVFFMYLAGINFSIHFQLLRGNPGGFFKDKEWRFYTIILLVSTLAIACNIFFTNYDPAFLAANPEVAIYKSSFGRALRDALFQVVSITTTTGFCTANFDLWPSFSRILLITLMFFGGCAGSTGGGMKQTRILIVFKEVFNEIRKLAHPKAVYAVKIGNDHIQDFVIRNVAAFCVLFVMFFAAITLFLSLMGYDIITAFSASIATLGNIGPGLARVGAIENYAFFDPFSKVVLIFSMLLGRLEIYSVLILFYSLFSRK